MKLILSIDISADIEAHLSSNIKIVQVNSKGDFDGDVSGAEVLYLSWPFLKNHILDNILSQVPTLRWHHTTSAGVEHILTKYLDIYLKRNIILTNGAGLHGVPIAEFVIAYMLSHAKHLPELHALQAQRQWKRGFNIKELTDTTLLIIGAGGIGQEIAARAKPFGIKVLGSRRHPQPLPNFDLVVGAEEWRHLLPKADYVVIATPLTPETKGLIDEAALSLLNPYAYLINIARGAIIDENALVKALKERWFAGAALDTTTIEPLPADSPLWSLDNVFLTPHCTAHSPKLNQRSVKLFIDNLTRFQLRLPLRNIVDKQAGY